MEASQQQPVTPAAPPAAPQPPTTDDLLRAALEEGRQMRAELAALRDDFHSSKQPQPPQQPARSLSPEEAMAARMEEISNHDWYCPGCGSLYDYRQRCTGKSESPHPPVEVVSTDELKSGDDSKHSGVEYVNA